MNFKFLAGLAVIVALVSGLAVINLAKKTAYTGEGQRVWLNAPAPQVSDTAAVDTAVTIAEHSVETSVTIK